jgi:septal ring factor EnvC (AmiA/AmiB activator)
MTQRTASDKDLEAVRAMLAGQDARLREVKEAMVTMQARLQAMSENIERMSGERGMPRCARQDERITELARSLERMAALPGGSKTCVEHTGRLSFLERKLDTLCQRLWWFAGSVSLAVVSLGLRMFWMSFTG